MSSAAEPEDPIALRRAQVTRWSVIAKKAGYGVILLAMVMFVVGAATTFSPVVTTTILVCLALSALLLIPAVIFGYGAKMAEREELGLPPGH